MTSPRTAVYPGTFDPFTRGHEDIARRALTMVDHLVVAVAHTSTQRKSGLFSVEERVELARELFADEPRIECTSFRGLVVDFCRTKGARLLVRGLRAVSDFEYELQLAQMNHELWDELETVFLSTDAEHSFISASLVKEVAKLGGDVDRFVSPGVAAAMTRKFGE